MYMYAGADPYKGHMPPNPLYFFNLDDEFLCSSIQHTTVFWAIKLKKFSETGHGPLPRSPSGGGHWIYERLMFIWDQAF